MNLAQSDDGIREQVQQLKRERVIEVAADLFHSRGFGNTSMDAVAEKLKVTKPFIYARFGAKSELLAEICSRGIRSSLLVLDRVLASPGAAGAKLRIFVHDFVLAVLRNQRNLTIYSREQKHLLPADAQAINSMRREFDRKFTALLIRGHADGDLTIEDPQITALAIGGIVSWCHIWYRPEGRFAPEETADRICELVLGRTHARAASTGAVRTAEPAHI